MYMFNYEKNGDRVAVVNSTKRQRKVYLSEDDGKESLELKDGNEFMLSPDKMKERETMYVCGSAGSGKKLFCGQIM